MKLYKTLALAASALFSSTAFAQLPLNTGLNYTNFSLYQMPGNGPAVQDNYWTLVASSGPLVPPSPGVPRQAYVVNTSSAWAQPMVGAPGPAGLASRWISATPTSGSIPNPNPSYFIFRKCFCLMSGFKNAQVSYALRSDEGTQVWLNTITHVMSGPSPVNFGQQSPPVNGGTGNVEWFHTGVNCMYVLVEDTGGLTGFNLVGQVSGLGVMATAGAGPGNPPSFAPCQCGGPAGKAAAVESRATLQAIVQYADRRLRERRATK